MWSEIWLVSLATPGHPSHPGQVTSPRHHHSLLVYARVSFAFVIVVFVVLESW